MFLKWKTGTGKTTLVRNLWAKVFHSLPTHLLLQECTEWYVAIETRKSEKELVVNFIKEYWFEEVRYIVIYE